MPTNEIMFLTDFADQAVILPLAATVACVLGLQRRWRVLGAWALSVAGVLGAVLVSKLAFYACGRVMALGLGDTDVHSPSGHAASAGVVYAGIAVLQAGLTRWPPVRTAVVAATLCGTAIGASRVALGAHSVGDVLVAIGFGVAGATAFPALAGRNLGTGSGLPALAAAVPVVALVHGLHFPAEVAIQDAGAGWVRTLLSACTAL